MTTGCPPARSSTRSPAQPSSSRLRHPRRPRRCPWSPELPPQPNPSSSKEHFMRTPHALLPLAIAAGLAAGASPASPADKPIAQASGGDVPPVVPSLIQTRITRAENALERLTQYVDDQDSAHVVTVSK